MEIIKDSEYNFTTITVGYLAFTSVDGSEKNRSKNRGRV